MKKYILLVAFTAMAIGLYAQPGPGPVFNPVPLDGGISLLLAAGAALGLKKAVKKTKN